MNTASYTYLSQRIEREQLKECLLSSCEMHAKQKYDSARDKKAIYTSDSSF